MDSWTEALIDSNGWERNGRFDDRTEWIKETVEQAKIWFIPRPPLVDVHGAGDGGAVVSDVGLQRAVHEQIVLLQ